MATLGEAKRRNIRHSEESDANQDEVYITQFILLVRSGEPTQRTSFSHRSNLVAKAYFSPTRCR